MAERLLLDDSKRFGGINGRFAANVGPGTKYACPITFSDVGGQYPSLTDAQVARLIVQDFEILVRRGHLSFPNWRHAGGRRGPVEFTYPSVDEIRAELADADLACNCPLDQACHADVLLDIANPVETRP